MKLLMYVQNLLGIGHQRRAELLAAGLVEAGFTVTVLSGGRPLPGENWGDVELVRLPSAQSAGTDFKTLVDQDGNPVDEAWRCHRRDALLAAFERVRPEAVLLESFPFARRQFRFELLPLLDAISDRQPRPLVVSSIRDILVEKSDPKRVAETVALVERSVDRVLVHGDPGIIELGRSFPAAGRLADWIHYTGYVTEPPLAAVTRRQRVVVSAGGGAVGAALLRAAIAARSTSLAAAWPWHLITGPMMPEAEAAELAAVAPPGIAVERHRTDFRGFLAGSALSISQAGYNTVLDLLATGIRAVLVPFAAPGETEQSLRARCLEAASRVVVVPEAALDGPTLAAAVDRALTAPVGKLDMDLEGVAGTARLLQSWLIERRRMA